MPKRNSPRGSGLPRKGTVFLSVNDRDKRHVGPLGKELHALGFRLLATRGTAAALAAAGIEAESVFKVNEGRPNIVDLVKTAKIDLVINTPLGRESFYDEKSIRRAAIRYNIPCITTLAAAHAAARGIQRPARAGHGSCGPAGLAPRQGSGVQRAPFRRLTMNLSGIFPALTTPYATDDSVSLDGVKHNIQRYNQTELAGYVVIGSTGESVLLQPKEMDAILVTVKESADPGKKLIAGTGAESTAETIERTKRAAALGYHVALVKTPHYFKPAYKPEVLIAHYRRVADSSPIPVLLYSVPVFTALALESPETIAMAAHPNIIGIKESSGNIQRISEMIAGAPPQFQVLVGSAPTVYPSLAIGARGAILALGQRAARKMRNALRIVSSGQMGAGSRTAKIAAASVETDRL